jgi:hypothetical protein
MRRLALMLVVVAGCTKAGTGHESAPGEPTPTTAALPAVKAAPPAPPKPSTRVELTAVTLADDCGGTPPSNAPAKLAKAELALPADSESKAKRDAAAGARAKRRCEQTSMQLTVIAGDASTIHVKSVELFDDAGKSLGTLTTSKPTRWSDATATYELWDEAVAAGSTTSVSYVLAQPNWDQIGNRWNRTYLLKTVLSVGGVDQAAQKTLTLTAPTNLPANVKT